MIEPCPICGKVPVPVKASWDAFQVECCGIKGRAHPWFMGAIRYWNRVIKERRENAEKSNGLRL